VPISPEAVELVRSIIPETSDQHLWTTIRDDTGHPSLTLLLAEIVVRLDRIEALLAADERTSGRD
jgi:hypothetical protein